MQLPAAGLRHHQVKAANLTKLKVQLHLQYKKLKESKDLKIRVKYVIQAITRSRAANSKKEVDTKANQRPTTKTSQCVFHRKYF